jgi:hypothetical protein
MRFLLPFCLTLCAFLPVQKVQAQHFYYMPNSVQMPMFKQQHDATIGVGWARGLGTKAWEFQAAYSPYKQVAVIANYLKAGEKEVLENTQEGLNYRFYELGAGVYEALPRGTASLLAGYGHGDIYNYFQGDEYADLNLARLFIQPAIMYHDDFFQGGLCFRVSRIKFNSGKVAIAIPPGELSVIEHIEEKSPFFLPEIGVLGGLTFGPCALNVAVCGIFPRTDNLNFVRINSSLILNVALGKLWQKEKEGAEKLK